MKQLDEKIRNLEEIYSNIKKIGEIMELEIILKRVKIKGVLCDSCILKREHGRCSGEKIKGIRCVENGKCYVWKFKSGKIKE